MGEYADIEHYFDSWGEFLDEIESNPPSHPLSGQSRSGSYDFTRTNTFEEALKLARTGWAEHRVEVEKIAADLEFSVGEGLRNSFDIVSDVSGQEVNVGAYLSGEPECMFEFSPVKVSKPGRVITIVVNGSIGGGVEVSELVKRGAAVTALVDLLERLQHSTEVYLEFGKSEVGTNLVKTSTLIKLKAAAAPLDLDLLMFATAHPSCNRRLMFAFSEKHHSIGSSSYGLPPRQCWQAERVGANIILDGVDLGETAESWIKQHLTEWGFSWEDN